MTGESFLAYRVDQRASPRPIPQSLVNEAIMSEINDKVRINSSSILADDRALQVSK